MIRYKVMRNGICTNQWTSDWAGRDHYETSFGKPERWAKESECTDADKLIALETRRVKEISGSWMEFKLPAEFTIVEEDMTAELTTKANEEKDRQETIKRLKALVKTDLKTAANCADAILDIIKCLKL